MKDHFKVYVSSSMKNQSEKSYLDLWIGKTSDMTVLDLAIFNYYLFKICSHGGYCRIDAPLLARDFRIHELKAASVLYKIISSGLLVERDGILRAGWIYSDCNSDLGSLD